MALTLGYFSHELGIPIWLLMIAIVWSLFWKAIALWRSARRNHVVWFVVFVLVHTLGILEILYLFLFSKINLNEKIGRPKPKPKRRKKNAA